MSGKTILIADGNKHDRQMLSKRLVAEGYEVIQAEDGAEAVTTVHSHKPDLVLLSTNFPPDVAHGGGAFETGFLIIDWLKRMQEAESVRIILITDQDAAKLHDKARATGALGLFQKPVDEEALLSAVQRILGSVPPPTE
jgi:CheY-like chemotaxis protein